MSSEQQAYQLTTSAIARAADCSETVVWKYTNAGKVTHTRLADGTRAYPAEAIDEVVALLGDEPSRHYAATYQAECARLRRESRKSGKPKVATSTAVAKYDAAIATLRAQLKADALPEEVALDAIASTEKRRQAAIDATDARTERKGADVVQLLPAMAETLGRSLELAVRERGFLRPDEVAEAKMGLRYLLGGSPMRIERLADGRAALRVRLTPQALIVAASGGVDNVVAGAGFEPATFGL